MFELPLLGGFWIVAEEVCAGWVGGLGSKRLGGAWANGLGELVRLLPEIVAGKEGVLKRGARTPFQVRIAELVVDRGPGVLVSQIDA